MADLLSTKSQSETGWPLAVSLEIPVSHTHASNETLETQNRDLIPGRCAGTTTTVFKKHLWRTRTILGSLLIIEGLGGVIVSLTEWWRLSHIGVSLGLMAGGFSLPVAGTVSVGVPVGGAFLFGSLLSAAILYWQLRHHASSHADRNA